MTPITLEGYGITIKISGGKPTQPIEQWQPGDPTYSLMLADGKPYNGHQDVSTELLFLLQDEGYLSRSAAEQPKHLRGSDNLKQGNIHDLRLTSEGLYLLKDDGTAPQLLMAAES